MSKLDRIVLYLAALFSFLAFWNVTSPNSPILHVLSAIWSKK